jgi:hypothetical protein
MPRVKTCRMCHRKATARGLCEVHQCAHKPRADNSLWRSTRGQRLRAWQLAEHPYCDECGAVAKQVHHKQSQIDRPDLILAIDNLQSLCHACHCDKHKSH